MEKAFRLAFQSHGTTSSKFGRSPFLKNSSCYQPTSQFPSLFLQRTPLLWNQKINSSPSLNWSQARFYAAKAEKKEKDEPKKKAPAPKKKVKDEKQLKKEQLKKEEELKKLEERKSIVTVETVGVAPQSTAELFSKTIEELKTKEKKEVKQKEKKLPTSKLMRKQKGWRKRGPKEARAVGKTLRISMKKLKLIADLIRGLTYKEAIIQLKLSKKRISSLIIKIMDSCRFNAENIHGLDPERLVVSEIWTGRANYITRRRYHSRGRMGIMRRPRTNLHIILKEFPPGDPKLLTKAQLRERHYIERLERLAKNLKTNQGASQVTQQSQVA